MRVVSSGIVVASRIDRGEGSCCVAHTCVTSTGRWIVGFRAAADKAQLHARALLTWSDDEGGSWCEPFEPFAVVPDVAGRAGSFRSVGCTVLADGRLAAMLFWLDVSRPERAFFDDATESLVDSQLFLSVSEDDGATWAKPWHVDPDCYRDQARPKTGPMLVMGDGRWACQFELNKRYDVPPPWIHKPVLSFSSDEGQTWPNCVLPASDPTDRVFYWDQRPSVIGADGRVLNMFWSYDRVASCYLNIHGAESTDHGRTWSQVWDTGVPGQPAPPKLLPNGDIVMVYVDRTGEPTIAARVSHDGGRTFDADTHLVIHRRGDIGKQEDPDAKAQMGDAWDEMYAYSVGLPSTASLGDGRVLVTWYTGPAATQTDIGWALVDSRA